MPGEINTSVSGRKPSMPRRKAGHYKQSPAHSRGSPAAVARDNGIMSTSLKMNASEYLQRVNARTKSKDQPGGSGLKLDVPASELKQKVEATVDDAHLNFTPEPDFDALVRKVGKY